METLKEIEPTQEEKDQGWFYYAKHLDMFWMFADGSDKSYLDEKLKAITDGVVETFASEDTGTWTILMTMPNGTACLMAAGEAFEQIDVAQSSVHDGT